MTHNIDIEKLEKHVRQIFQIENEKEHKRLIINHILRKFRKKQARRKILIFTIPSVVAATLVVWLLVIPPASDVNPDEYYQEHFQPKVSQTQYRGSNSTKDQNNLNNEILNIEEQISDAKLAMSAENWEQASNIFNNLLPKGGSIKVECLWHLALINLKTKQYEECKTKLSELLRTKDPTYQKEAKELLRWVKKAE